MMLGGGFWILWKVLLKIPFQIIFCPMASSPLFPFSNFIGGFFCLETLAFSWVCVWWVTLLLLP